MKYNHSRILERDALAHSRAIRRHADVSDRAARRSRQRRDRRRRRHSRNLDRALNAVVHTIFSIVMGAMLAILLIEATAGCGQTHYHADGTTTAGECLFLPQRGTPGRWK